MCWFVYIWVLKWTYRLCHDEFKTTARATFCTKISKKKKIEWKTTSEVKKKKTPLKNQINFLHSMLFSSRLLAIDIVFSPACLFLCTAYFRGPTDTNGSVFKSRPGLFYMHVIYPSSMFFNFLGDHVCIFFYHFLVP